jgi:riboflavin biosynthesis pyrimidine reductase
MKPYVICHMCTSIDGRIMGERWGKLPGGLDSGKLFETTANSFGIKAWLVGTTTMREFSSRDFALKSAGEQIERGDYVAAPKAKSFAIGADAKGVLRFKRGDVSGDHTVVLISELASNDYLAHLRAAGVSYLFCGRDHVDLRKALRKIGSVLGIRKLLLEGGGLFNGAMLKAGLIDEISHVIVPVVDGGTNVATVFDIPGPAPRKAAAALRPIKHQKLAGGIQWHRYRVAGKT